MTGYRVGSVGWSGAEIDTIKKRWAKGDSATQIAMDAVRAITATEIERLTLNANDNGVWIG